MDVSTLRLEDFNYDLPIECIAQQPLQVRSHSRLLVRKHDGELLHQRFDDLPKLLPKGTLLIYNDSRVLPGRLMGKTPHGGKIEIMLLRPLSGTANAWQALGKPFKKLRKGQTIQFSNECSALVTDQLSETDQPFVNIEFNLAYDLFLVWMESNGLIPLPPYISRTNLTPVLNSEDKVRYQTIYANTPGSVAAPTAGLHFDPPTWSRLQESGIRAEPVTLHVGGGTFLPVKTSEIHLHTMHKEVFRVSKSTYFAIQKNLQDKLPILAVGTTSLRCLESFARLLQNGNESEVLDSWQETDLFLYPKGRHDKVQPWAIDGLITNFHQPESTLLMLVSTLIGYEEVRTLYAKALTSGYRFLSYGDASLLWLK